MAIVKSNAYGHNLKNLIYDIDNLVDGYGVVRISEANLIRKVSKKKILLMQGVYSSRDLKSAKKNNYDLVVHDQLQFDLLEKHNFFKNIWIKVNTGMNRLGFNNKDFKRLFDKSLFDKDFILMSHLACSDNPKDNLNNIQFSRFDKVASIIPKRIKKSIANTGCLINFPEFSFDWVRCGIGIYGGHFSDDALITAMTLRSRIVSIRKVQPNERVGYGGRRKLSKEIKIANVYIGYADGLPSSLADGTKVMINNQEATLFGKVSMDLVTLDVTNISNCNVGDWCEFFSPNFSIKNIAQFNNQITYDFMTKISPRVKRIYKELD